VRLPAQRGPYRGVGHRRMSLGLVVPGADGHHKASPGRPGISLPALSCLPGAGNRANLLTPGQQRGRDLKVLDECGVGLVALVPLHPDHR
jgi:hypothetical protein